jgi:hypothetical protein
MEIPPIRHRHPSREAVSTRTPRSAVICIFVQYWTYLQAPFRSGQAITARTFPYRDDAGDVAEIPALSLRCRYSLV